MADDLDTFNPVGGAARELVDSDELANPQQRAAIVFDRRRRQTRYADDHFLVARDLTRGQQYGLLREADLAQMSGTGIVRGLEVTANALGARLRISAGLGVARTGETLVLRGEASLDVASLAVVSERRAAGALTADVISRAHTGLYVLVARPIEYARELRTTSVAVGLSSNRVLEAELAEGTWFTLTPLPAVAAKDVVARGRARLAREVFLGGLDPSSLTDGLALAVIGVAGGRVQWVDRALASRDVGGDAIVGFGLQRRKQRLAYQRQFSEQLKDESERRRASGVAEGFLATEAFDALPPAGPLPRSAVTVTQAAVQQSFFPRELYVEVALTPEDEVPALLAEGLLRAPIDLTQDAKALETVPVLIVVPVPRSGFEQRLLRLDGVYRSSQLPATGRSLVNARPIDGLAALRNKNEANTAPTPIPLDLEAWRKAIDACPQLWYVRRQQYSPVSPVITRLPFSGEGQTAFERLDTVSQARLSDASEIERFNLLFGNASDEILADTSDLLNSAFLSVGVSPIDAFSPATSASVYISAILGELAYMLRRTRPRVLADPAITPPSPAFEPTAASPRWMLRQVELGDIERITARFLATNVGGPLLAPELRSPFIRAVLAGAAVVPELAFWTTTADGINSGGVLRLAGLASAADVTTLKELARSITLPPTV